MKTRSGIFIRRQGGRDRYYGRLNGVRIALCLPGSKRAVTDEATAQALYGQLVAERQKQQLRQLHDVPEPITLASAARDFLIAKAEEAAVTTAWLEGEELRLQRAVEHLGGDRDLATIRVADLKRYAGALRRRGLTGGTIRQHLNTISAVYRWAGEEERVEEGRNPVAAWRKKPTAQRREATWLEISDAALLLEAARRYQPQQPKGGRPPMPFIYPLLAVYLLTGARESEALGLAVSDVSFDRRTITFRTNEWRRLKTETSHRVVPMPPQLEEVLRPYVFGARPPSHLLFPSFVGGSERMVTDWRKVLDAVAVRAGWHPGEIRSKMFRHSFCAAALQLLDGDEPISVYTVSRWMGHGGSRLVERTYSHLGTIRHRSKVLEFRAEQHTAILGDRLRALTGSVDGSVSGALLADRVS